MNELQNTKYPYDDEPDSYRPRPPKPAKKQRSVANKVARVGAAGAGVVALGLGVNALANHGDQADQTVNAKITFGAGEDANPSTVMEVIEEDSPNQSFNPSYYVYQMQQAELSQHTGPQYVDPNGNPITQPGESIDVTIPKPGNFPQTINYPAKAEFPAISISYPSEHKK